MLGYTLWIMARNVEEIRIKTSTPIQAALVMGLKKRDNLGKTRVGVRINILFLKKKAKKLQPLLN